MKRTRIKICGITNLSDALYCVQAGADALGFNLYQKSTRYVDLETIAAIVEQLPPYITTVALLVNAEPEEIHAVTGQNLVDQIQFHGDESAEFCQSFNFPFIKALRVENIEQLETDFNAFSASRGILLDAHVDGQYGGTGITINWQELPAVNVNLVLAGGLNAENVATAISVVKPFAVDVCGGVEKTAGVKDVQKLNQFIASVRAADTEVYG